MFCKTTMEDTTQCTVQYSLHISIHVTNFSKRNQTKFTICSLAWLLFTSNGYEIPFFLPKCHYPWLQSKDKSLLKRAVVEIAWYNLYKTPIMTPSTMLTKCHCSFTSSPLFCIKNHMQPSIILNQVYLVPPLLFPCTWVLSCQTKLFWKVDKYKQSIEINKFIVKGLCITFATTRGLIFKKYHGFI